jgi:hypothetical protein
VARDTDDSTDDDKDEAEATQLLPEDRVALVDHCGSPLDVSRGKIYDGVKAEGTLHGEVNTLYHALPKITKSKRPSSLTIVNGDVKQSRLLAYEQRIRAYNVVAEVFELLANDPVGYDNN